MRRLSSDTVIALLLLGLCGLFFYETFHFRRTPLSIVPSSLWPRIVIIALALLSLAYLITSLRRSDANEEERISVPLTQWISDNRNVLWCFGLFTVYVVTVPYLGMLLGSMAFVFAALTMMGTNRLQSHVINLVITVVAVGGMWSVFTFGLNVMLPEGRILRIF